MLKNENKIFKKSISVLLVAALIISGLFLYPEEAQAITVDQTVTKYHLDIGAQQVWGMGKTVESAVWDNGREKGSTISVSATLEFPQTVKNVKAYPYASPLFKWGEEGYTFNENSFLARKKDFDDNYWGHASVSISNIKASSNGSKVKLSYNAMMASTTNYDLKTELNKGNLNIIFELMGGEYSVKSNYPEVYKKLVDGANNGLGGNIYGFMYFTPVIIQYDVVEQIEIGDLQAKLELPVSAAMGEAYTLSDKSKLSNNLEVSEAILEEKIGSRYEEICTWQGNNRKGENTGGTITEKSEKIGEKTYRLTVNTKEGKSDIDERTIQIVDGTKIEGQATLILPEYTYEGHPTPAEDVSTFTVDDVQYTGRRAYQEGIARNDFVTVPYSAGNVSKNSRNPTEATAVFPKRGNYNVRLNVDLRNGASLSDIKPIEVRKTPYIIEGLGGFQKQNRKQILTASVATYPGKPIVDYYIKVRDMKTGEEIHLTKNDPQNNTVVVKTRTLRKNGDQYWTNFELEFLTKVQGEFRYTIYAIDSKGDSDIKQKEFIVRPDLPPVPKIIIEDTFLRNKGANVAEIIAEDGSTTDGDQLKRTWILEDKPVENLAGFEDKSFGSRQKIKFEKVGVGKLGLNLHVKDVWNEPTLEEYILSSDYLEAVTEANSEVINIAPTVKLEPTMSKEIDMIILASKTSLPGISARLNALKAVFIENGLDPNFSLVGISESDEGPYRKVATWEWDTTVNCRMCQSNSGQIDTDFAYRVTSPGKVVSGYQQICVNTGPHVVEALCPGDERCKCAINSSTGVEVSVGSQHIVWSYPVNESQSFGIYLDNIEKYIYVPLYNKGATLILNRNNGALVTEIPVAIPSAPKVAESNDNLYFVNANSVQKYDSKKNIMSTVVNQGGNPIKFQGGKIAFVGKKQDSGNLAGGGKGLFVGQFDMKTEQVKEIAIGNLEGYAGAVSGYDMDIEGRVLIGQPGKLWLVDTKTQDVKILTKLGVGTHMNSTGFVRDEMGRAKYIYHAYNSTDSKMRGRFYLSLYDFSGEQIVHKASENGEFAGYNWTGITYAKLHTRENKIYILQGANWQYFDMYTTSVRGFSFALDLNTMKFDWGYTKWGWDLAEESGGYNESLMKTFSKYDAWNGQTDTMKLFRNNITDEEAVISAFAQKANFSDEAIEKIVAIFGDEQFQALMNNPTFKIIMDRNGATFLAGHGDEIFFVESIKERLEQEKKVLRIKGSDGGGVGLSKMFMLEPNSEYVYRYNLTAIAGTAIDMFKPLIGKAEESKNAVNKVLVSENYVGFKSNTKGADYPGGGGSHSIVTDYDMEEGGYIEFEYTVTANRGTLQMTLDGKILKEHIYSEGYINLSEKISVFLPKGKHKISIYSSVGRSDRGALSMNNIKVYYLRTGNPEFAKINTIVREGNSKLIENKFKLPADGAFTILDKNELGQIMQETFKDNAVSQIKYLKFVNSGSAKYQWGFSEKNGSAGMGSGYYGSAIGYMQVQAPEDKILIFDFKESVYRPVRGTPSNNGGRMLAPTTVILKPGEVYTRSYYIGSNDMYGNVSISDIKIAELEKDKYDANRVYIKNGFKNVYLSNEVEPFYEIEILDNTYTTTKYIDLNDRLGISSLSFDTVDANMKNFESYISDFRLYRVLQGKEQLVFKENFNSLETFKENKWKVVQTENGEANIVAGIIPKEKKEEVPLIYKKGQLVTYNIFYDDYENDPSKKKYWRYTHTPFNDGPHPEAAIVLNEDGKVVSNNGKTLSASIDRFHIDGKYMVEHWQEDNTARSDMPKGEDGFPTGNPDYDKSSNVESLIFYVEGGASAPWITSIKTVPGAVKEGNLFKIQIGMDDKEKDELNLTTEVYKNKKLIYTHRQKNILAVDIGNGVKGNYPLVLTGNVPNSLGGSEYKAQIGIYEVVCTVRDKTGAGIGSYRFTLISDGKITGYVNHTDKWNENRKKYNVKRPVKGDEETPRGKHIFWSGEKFMLEAAVAGTPTKVACHIQGYPSYNITMKSTGKRNSKGEIVYEGSMWDKFMINKWGKKLPQPLTFRFTAFYDGGTSKIHDVNIVVDSKNDYYLLHRLF